jgi:predicted anti-sigma-YlaC factor YlaD
MGCRDTVHLICWYLEGKLSPSVESEIERHLNGCRDCRVVLEAASKTLDQHLVTGKAAHAA